MYDNSSNAMHTCENTPNSVGLILGNDMVIMWYLLTWESPIGKCDCEDDYGHPIGFTRYFWNPLTSNETTSLNYAANNSKVAFQLDTDEGTCYNLCLCDEFGECYYNPHTDRSKSSYRHIYLEFIPYCDESSCHMYARLIYWDGFFYGPLVSTKNRTINQPNDTGNFATNTNLIKVASVSCDGCQSLNYTGIECNGQKTIKTANETLLIYPYITYTNGSKTYIFPSIYKNFDVFVGRNLSDPKFVLVDAIESIKELCSQSMDKLNSLDVSYYDDDATNLCIYANLIEFAKAHGYGDLTIEQILAINELKIEQQIRGENFVLLLVIGIPGIILSITVIVVIALKKGVTSFDMLCFFIAIVDLVFILNAVVLEGVVGHNIAGYSNINAYVSIYIDSTTPILGHPLSYTIFYIHIISSIPSSILCTFRSLNRMVAIYFPINYSFLFTNKRMIILSLGVIMLTIVGCLPIWIFSGDTTKNFYFYSFLNVELASEEEVPVVLPYFFISSYSEYITIMISIVIDTCTAIKLAMYFKSHADGWTASKLIRELYFLFQNFITVIMFLVSLIPYILFMTVCQGLDRRCYITPLQQLIVLLYECYSRRVMWRMIDQLAALIVQIRIYWDDIKTIFVKTPSTATPVVFLK